jgi:hypothetical protein
VRAPYVDPTSVDRDRCGGGEGTVFSVPRGLGTLSPSSSLLL